jgi:hypothetical protein
MALATPFIAHAINVLLRCDDPRADDGMTESVGSSRGRKIKCRRVRNSAATCKSQRILGETTAQRRLVA